MEGQLFAFVWGRHPLEGTYEEQREAFARIARKREEIENSDEFKEIEKNATDLTAKEIRLTQMDFVWAACMP